ncbi:MAG: MFS transporter [Puniceicoccales bacterium]
MYQQEALRKLTYRYDLIRGAFGGILEIGALSFGLLAAIRYFDAPDFVKGLLSAGIAFGLFFAPFGQIVFARTGLPASKTGSLCFLGAAVGYAVASQAQELWVFTLTFLGANALLAQIPSLFVAVYAKNYTHRDRGRLVSNTFIVATVVGTILSFFGGEYLDYRPEAFGSIFLLMSGAALVCALAVLRIPSEPIQIRNPKRWGNFSLITEDPLFAKMLAAWMILGFANLSLLPLRVEILANPKYGFNLSNSHVILITVVVFAVARIAGLKVFGSVFERINFLTYRILINVLLFLAILCYFNFSSVWFVALGSAFFGFGMGGGNLAWNLWVTRIAPDDRVSEYMSVHMSLTGMRGVLSPIIAYSLLPIASPQTLSWVSLSFLTVSGLMFYSLLRNPVTAATFSGRDVRD